MIIKSNTLQVSGHAWMINEIEEIFVCAKCKKVVNIKDRDNIVKELVSECPNKNDDEFVLTNFTEDYEI